MTLLEPDAGWSAVWRIPAIESEEALVLRLLADSHVLVHPGYFFDFAREAFLVTSLLPEPHVFDDGIGRVMGAIDPGR
jgi:aspartate/methionine/tyrosine aminotransferase